MGIIQRQSIKNFFTSYIGVLIGFLNVLIIQPRFLTAEELGLTRVLYSFALLIATVVPLGSGNIAIKFFPYFRNKEKKHHGFFGFLTAATAVGFLITATVILIFKDILVGQYIEKSVLFAEYFNWVLPLILFQAFITQLNIYCYSLYKSTVPAFLNDIVIRGAVIVVVSLYYLKWFDLDVFIALFVLIYGVQALTLLMYIFYEEKPGFKIDFSYLKSVGIKPLLKFGIIIWLASISSMGIKELATILLGTKVALSNVAIYVVAAFIPTLIEVPLNALDKIATFNITTALAEKNMKVVDEIYCKSARYMLIIGGLLFLLINCNATSILMFLPEKYRGGELIILVLSAGTLFNMATGLNSQILVYSDKYFYGAFMLIVSVIINIGLLFLLIPAYGVIGAAIATATAGVTLNLINSLIIFWHYALKPIDFNTVKIIFLILVVFSCDFIIPHLSNWILDIVLHAGVIFFLFCMLVYYFNFIPEMNKFLKQKMGSFFKGG